MKTPRFTITGKISHITKHDDGYFMLLVHKTKNGEYFTYPAKYKGELPLMIEKELKKLPVIYAEGKILSVEEDGLLGMRLYINSFHVLKALS